MAIQMLRRNLGTMVLMGLGVVLLVEYLKISASIGEYEADSDGMDIDRPLIQVKTDGIKSGKELKFKKPSSSRVEDKVEEKGKIEEIGIALEPEKGVEKKGLMALETDRQPLSKSEQQMEQFRRTTSEKDGSVESQGRREETEFKLTGNNNVNTDLDVKRLLPEDEKGFDNYSKQSPLNDGVEIYIDTSRPVLNPHPFRYLINSPDVCKGVKVFLLCYVHTAVKHAQRRKRIRSTWGNRNNYPGFEMRVVFFVGMPQLNTTQGRFHQDYLKYESKRHGDIVQEDFLDTYKNLSHKGVGALKWVSTYCNHTAYVLKTDDDMFVNMYVLLNHLRNLHAAHENFRRRLILCYVFWRMHVDREGGQWSLTRDYFPDDVYPPYCSGMGFVVSSDVATAMYRVSPYVRFLWVDDAFISGVLPAALQGAVNHTTWAKTYCAAFEMGVYTHPTEWYKYVFSHVHNETLNLLTWKGLTDIVRNRTIPRPSVIKPGHLADEYIPLSRLFPHLPPAVALSKFLEKISG